MSTTASDARSALSLRFTIKPGQREQLLVELNKILELCAKEPEFVSGHLQESPTKPYELRLFEIWKGSEEEFARVQGVKPYRLEYLRKSRDLVAAVEVEWGVITHEWFPV